MPQRAIALNSSSGLTHAAFSTLLVCLGRFEQAIAEATRGRALEPMSALIGHYVALTFISARRFHEVLDVCRRALDLDPSFALVCALQSFALSQLGKHDAAIEAADRALTLSRNQSLYLAHAGWVNAAAGRREKASAILADLRARSEREYIRPSDVAAIAVALGEIDQAFEWLERAYEERSPILPGMGVSPTWDPLRGDPRFGVLLKKLGLDGIVPATG
jgi:tetratricopeptide (TPR) repeat protein